MIRQKRRQNLPKKVVKKMMNKLTDPKFVVPVLIVALVAIALSRRVAIPFVSK